MSADQEALELIELLTFKDELMMAYCPNFGKKIDTPDKKIEDSFFFLEVYSCDKCGNHFKVGGKKKPSDKKPIHPHPTLQDTLVASSSF